MAKHDVSFIVPERLLGKADIEFKVKRNNEILGRLKVSNGSIVWVPKSATYGYKVDWVKFDQVMKDNGKHEK